MKSPRSNVMYSLIAMSLVIGFGFNTFAKSDMAQAGIRIAPNGAAPSYRMPTARDLTVFERRLRKASRESQFAKTCGRGQLLGNAAIHVAMHFPPLNAPATAEAPGFARAHVNPEVGTPKVVVLDSKDPTLWTVTGEPRAIILTGNAVVAEYPESTPIFAPRFADACRGAAWAMLPKSWAFPPDQSKVNSMVNNLRSRFSARASSVSKKLFDRDATGWEARRGDAVITF